MAGRILARPDNQWCSRAYLDGGRRTARGLPSSRRLARLITSEITPTSAPVLELEPGTGVFTQALLTRGLREDQLILVEFDPHLARRLERDYPDAWIVNVDAARLRQINIVDGDPVGAVVSGLPLLSMSMRGSHGDSAVCLPAPSSRRFVLSAHLWTPLPCAAARARADGPQGCAHGLDMAEPSSGSGIPDSGTKETTGLVVNHGPPERNLGPTTLDRVRALDPPK